jgi:hypothetical protein
MKRLLLTATLMLLVTALFAQAVEDWVSTTEGEFFVSIEFAGNAPGKGRAGYEAGVNNSRTKGTVTEGVKLTKGQWEAVGHMLNRYQSRRGDIYFVVVGTSPHAYSAWGVIVEFTSDTQYRYWVWHLKQN